MSELAVVWVSARAMLFPEFTDAFLFFCPSVVLFRIAGYLVVSDLHGCLLFMHTFDELSDHPLELHEGSLLRR